MIVGSHFGFTSDFQGDKTLAPLYSWRSSQSLISDHLLISGVYLFQARRPESSTVVHPSLYASPELGGLVVDNMLHVIALTLSCA